MTLYDSALATLRVWTPPTPVQARLRERYVAHLEAYPDGLQRSCLPDHLTASTLVISPDGEQVLLTLHAKAQRWFQFGGHLEEGDASLEAGALREGTEESGLSDLTLLDGPVQLSEHEVPFCGPAGDVHHLDVRFVAVAPLDSVHAVSEESLDVAWWPAAALPDPDPDLVELVAFARRRVELGRG